MVSNMKKIFNPPDTKQQRQTLRNNMPLAELLLWSRLKGSQIKRYKFRRQQGIGKLIIDFYCPRANLAIEIDGESHFENNSAQRRDRKKEAYLQSLGIRILRFTNTEVYANLDGVVNVILQNLS